MWQFTEDCLGPLPYIFGSSGPEKFVLVNESSGHSQNKRTRDIYIYIFLESNGSHHLILKLKREVTVEMLLAPDFCWCMEVSPGVVTNCIPLLSSDIVTSGMHWRGGSWVLPGVGKSYYGAEGHIRTGHVHAGVSSLRPRGSGFLTGSFTYTLY